VRRFFLASAAATGNVSGTGLNNSTGRLAPARQPVWEAAMRVRYLIINRRDRVRKAPRRLIEAAWDKAPSWDASSRARPWDYPNRDIGRDLRALARGRVLRLFTAVLDRGGHLLDLYYLTMPLNREGELPLNAMRRRFEDEVRLPPRCPFTEAAEQMGGEWPANLFLQLAAALNVPVEEVQDCSVGFGGPLAVAVGRNLFADEALDVLRRKLRREGKDV
jgi:hypothetical protein